MEAEAETMTGQTKKKAFGKARAETKEVMPFSDVPQDIKFPEEEEKTLNYWDEIDAFQESLRSLSSFFLECNSSDAKGAL